MAHQGAREDSRTSRAPTTIFLIRQMRSQRIVLLSPHPPLPRRSPSMPWAAPLAGSPTLSPSLPTLLHQHCPPPHTSTTPDKPTPSPVCLPLSNHPFPFHSPELCQFCANSQLKVPRGPCLTHIHGRGGGQTGVIHCLITTLARCFPTPGLSPLSASLLKRQLRSLRLRWNTDTIGQQCLTSSVRL